ncbi:hypothetical protein ABID30_001702 [Enterococcus rotai]|uniref:Uncharacterized protein n=1 Tax=Enterococcus rotai TaxID=118060 RepID=A0A0U2XC20_9ENTE|nr:hypothetical protein [Enterococcus rotai]ALS37712.1 hypothetical protein ATZ35_11285 [Enterococcus rotai]
MATIGSEVPQKETNSQKKNKSQLAKTLRVEEQMMKSTWRQQGAVFKIIKSPPNKKSIVPK